jgi:hypothetical protein
MRRIKSKIRVENEVKQRETVMSYAGKNTIS